MVSISRLSSEEYDYLLANGWFVAGSELRHANTTLARIISLEYADEFGGAFVSYIGGGAGLDWNYSLPFTDRGGVTVALGDSVFKSAIAVERNSISGSVTGNNAASSLTAGF